MTHPKPGHCGLPGCGAIVAPPHEPVTVSGYYSGHEYRWDAGRVRLVRVRCIEHRSEETECAEAWAFNEFSTDYGTPFVVRAGRRCANGTIEIAERCNDRDLVIVDGTAYYAIESYEGIRLHREVMALDAGNNTVRRRTAPTPTTGLLVPPIGCGSLVRIGVGDGVQIVICTNGGAS